MEWKDDIDSEYHLTAYGWVSGTEYFYGEASDIIKRPQDAIETWVRKMQQASRTSPERVDWERIWTSPKSSEFEKENLKRSYPFPA